MINLLLPIKQPLLKLASDKPRYCLSCGRLTSDLYWINWDNIQLCEKCAKEV